MHRSDSGRVAAFGGSRYRVCGKGCTEERDGGDELRIITMASLFGQRGGAGRVAYGASKGGVRRRDRLGEIGERKEPTTG
ncbi:MAG TPA: hypothetical protein VG127_01740 [Rubrobacteraceae bacterium]|nr:hypothetical protein [Rubrobacteraceae bacterium]